MPARVRTVFPLVPRYRVAGLPLGGGPSLRRGHGSDVAGSRAYVRGDPISTIDWRASARLSTARGQDEFVVRERYAEEAPRVVVLCDRRPSMALYPPPFPWLSKVEAVRSALELIVASAEARNAAVAYLDYAAPQSARGSRTGSLRRSVARAAQIEARQREAHEFDAPDEGIARGLEFLARFRSELSSGTFVFVISDFLGAAIPDSCWLTAAARRWEVVPVVVQDPTWEQSFPLVRSVVVPLSDPADGESFEVRLSRREARSRRRENERRLEALLGGFRALALEPVLIETSEASAIDRTFVEWADRRRTSGADDRALPGRSGARRPSPRRAPRRHRARLVERRRVRTRPRPPARRADAAHARRSLLRRSRDGRRRRSTSTLGSWIREASTYSRASPRTSSRRRPSSPRAQWGGT